MAFSAQSPPAGWVLTQGIWGTDAELLQAGASPRFQNDKYVRLKNTAVAARVESGKIPFRGPAGLTVVYDVGMVFQASSTAAGHFPKLGYTYYDNSGTALVTGYLYDSGNNQMDGTNLAPSTNPEYAAFPVALLGGNISYMKVFAEKSATAFNLDIHGIVVRPHVSYSQLAGNGTTAVADNSGTWTTLPQSVSGTYNKTPDYSGLPANASRAVIIPGLVMVHAVAKCADIPIGSEFAIQLSVSSLCNPAVTTYTGQRIVSSAASKTWEISATAIARPSGLSYVQVEAQHSGGGAAGNIDVELERGFITELQPWI